MVEAKDMTFWLSGRYGVILQILENVNFQLIENFSYQFINNK